MALPPAARQPSWPTGVPATYQGRHWLGTFYPKTEDYLFGAPTRDEPMDIGSLEWQRWFEEQHLVHSSEVELILRDKVTHKVCLPGWSGGLLVRT